MHCPKSQIRHLELTVRSVEKWLNDGGEYTDDPSREPGTKLLQRADQERIVQRLLSKVSIRLLCRAP